MEECAAYAEVINQTLLEVTGQRSASAAAAV